VPAWKDVDEAEAALAAGRLTSEDLAEAWRQGHEIVRDLAQWPGLIGDWRAFIPPADWSPLPLPLDWDS
jgi:hypothetical protein